MNPLTAIRSFTFFTLVAGGTLENLGFWGPISQQGPGQNPIIIIIVVIE